MMARAHILLVASALLFAAPAKAAVPEFAPDSETVLVGAGRGQPAGASSSAGEWKNPGATLHPGKAAIKARGHWLFGGAGSGFKNGQLRVRFRKHRRLDVTLLVRAAAGGKVSSGVGIRLNRGWVSLVRLTDGKPTALTRPRKLGWVSSKKQLEVVVHALGPHLVAALYQAPKGKAVMALTAGGLEPRAGKVGLVLGKRHDRRSRITLVATRPACRKLPEAKVGWRPHIIASIPTEKAAGAGAAGLVLEALPGSPPRTVLRASPAGVERLFCDRRGILSLSIRVPWKYFDLDYLGWRKAKPKVEQKDYPVHQSYLGPDQVARFLKAVRQRHPKDSLLKVLGKSHQGRPIYALGVGEKIRENPGRPTFLIVGAHHGNEPMSVLFVLDAISQLLDRGAQSAKVRRWLSRANIWCVPLANPDGLETYLEHDRFMGRKNGQGRAPLKEANMELGVDLNRNYPFRWNTGTRRASSGDAASRYYRGPSAGSEPETRAIMGLADRERFAGVITIHTGTVALLAPYTIDDVKNPDPNEAWMVAEQLIKDLPKHPQGKPWLVRRNLYSVDGTDQDWHRNAHGSVALLVEGARWSPRKAHNRQRLIKAIRPLWTRMLDRFLDGPAVAGTVLSADGKPAAAEVILKQAPPQEGERWTTRPRDGRFFRFLPGKDTYHLEVKAADGGRRLVTVDARKGGVVEVQVQLPGSP